MWKELTCSHNRRNRGFQSNRNDAQAVPLNPNMENPNCWKIRNLWKAHSHLSCVNLIWNSSNSKEFYLVFLFRTCTIKWWQTLEFGFPDYIQFQNLGCLTRYWRMRKSYTEKFTFWDKCSKHITPSFLLPVRVFYLCKVNHPSFSHCGDRYSDRPKLGLMCLELENKKGDERQMCQPNQKFNGLVLFTQNAFLYLLSFWTSSTRSQSVCCTVCLYRRSIPARFFFSTIPQNACQSERWVILRKLSIFLFAFFLWGRGALRESYRLENGAFGMPKFDRPHQNKSCKSPAPFPFVLLCHWIETKLTTPWKDFRNKVLFSLFDLYCSNSNFFLDDGSEQTTGALLMFTNKVLHSRTDFYSDLFSGIFQGWFRDWTMGRPSSWQRVICLSLRGEATSKPAILYRKLFLNIRIWWSLCMKSLCILAVM